MHWRMKGLVQKALGALPFGDRIHFHLQRRFGGLSAFERECDIKVDDWRLMMGHLRAAGVRLDQSTFLEIGTGWYPTFPLCLYLGGARRVMSLDLVDHVEPALVLALADRLADHVPTLAQETGRDEATIHRELRGLVSALRAGVPLAEATGHAIDLRAPADATRTGLPAESIDVVFSNSVLEHVPRDTIAAMFTESMRVLRPGGLAFHSVNCGDHYAYSDRSIHQLHYLQYSEAEWQRWNNRFLYQNRLRAKAFTELARDCGFVIELDTSRPHPTRLAQLDQIRVDPAFAHYTREELAITSIDFIGRKASAVHREVPVAPERPVRRPRASPIPSPWLAHARRRRETFDGSDG